MIKETPLEKLLQENADKIRKQQDFFERGFKPVIDNNQTQAEIQAEVDEFLQWRQEQRRESLIASERQHRSLAFDED